MYVVLAPIPGRLGGRGVWMRRVRPHVTHHELVHVPHLLHSEQGLVTALAWTVGFLVHPLRRLCVAGDLHIFLELFVTDRPVLLKQLLDLFQDERVAFQGGRVMRFLVPDFFPDLFGFFRQGEAAEPRTKL